MHWDMLATAAAAAAAAARTVIATLVFTSTPIWAATYTFSKGDRYLPFLRQHLSGDSLVPESGRCASSAWGRDPWHT
jgi:hypothetical protein